MTPTTLKMESVRSSESLAPFHLTTKHQPRETNPPAPQVPAMKNAQKSHEKNSSCSRTCENSCIDSVTNSMYRQTCDKQYVTPEVWETVCNPRGVINSVRVTEGQNTHSYVRTTNQPTNRPLSLLINHFSMYKLRKSASKAYMIHSMDLVWKYS
jgi:hypothetical protein